MKKTVLLLVFVLAGCTDAPERRADEAPPPAPVTTTSSVVKLPPRPKDIALDRLDPCQILDASQRKQLNLDNPPSPYVEPSFGNAKACTIRSNTSANVARLALVTASGVDVWLSDNAQVDRKISAINGYAAITVRTPDLDDVCNVEVDVAEGQFLDVMFRDGGNTPPTQQDHLCLGAMRVAEFALAGLLHTR
ncbi:hypothetical protein Lesp02_78340 [Lentzea sp. NBRC 105346]|uniref:DUF3558 domain-containing protein n=1 Tax=Lentzea sp. NBRC 105346 TaxID=3032205 RepID=UPI0024A5838D|nr:DUF3558 domain-containing protein [Lentzea sp. NBRC 105346]GLZ35647.1 hypothetical protein Lesp02_78340 [Lentzea sp. NBRC 105346]